jgi:hypothetical protein
MISELTLAGQYFWRSIKVVFVGSWLFISYYAVYLWYCIFTPKDANFIDDVPKLNYRRALITQFVYENSDFYVKWLSWRSFKK